jgi:prevent-host-death family protein
MKALGIFDVKTRLSEVCDDVAESGESVLITKRGRPHVVISPVPREGAGGSEVWEQRARYAHLATEEFPAIEREPEPPYNPFGPGD